MASNATWIQDGSMMDMAHETIAQSGNKSGGKKQTYQYQKRTAQKKGAQKKKKSNTYMFAKVWFKG